MATKTTLNLKGLEEWLAELALAGADIDAAADRALLKGGQLMQQRMIDLVPVRTGNLRHHIQVKGPQQEGNRHWIEVGIIPDKDYTDAETARYANSVEYGNSSMAAEPFIRPAIDQMKSAVLRAMKEELAL